MKFIFIVVAISSSSRGDGLQLQQLYSEACNSPASSSLEKQITSSLGAQDVNQLSSRDVSKIFQTVDGCLKSDQVSVQQLGLLFFLAAQMRWTGVPLLGSNISLLEKIASDSSSSLQNEALEVLTTMRPSVPKEVVGYLQSRLKETHMSPAIAAPIVVALLESVAEKNSIDEVLAFADSQTDVSVQIAAVKKLGQLHGPLLDSELAFIQKHLESANPYARRASVETVGRLPGAIRSRFLAQVTRIATDPNETEETRTLANHVVSQ